MIKTNINKIIGIKSFNKWFHVKLNKFVLVRINLLNSTHEF